MKIIEIKKSDKERIYKLAIEENKILKHYAPFPIYEVKFTRNLFNKLFRTNFGKNKFFYGIKEDEKIVATLSGYIKPAPKRNVGYIDNIFVSKKYYGRGYATLLKNEFFQWLKAKNIRYCQLHVLEKNPAKKIYDKWGFSIDGYGMTRKI